MKLICEADVASRLLPSFNLKKTSKGVRSQISIGRKPGSNEKDASLFLLICTTKDRAGTKYTLKNNVQQIFAKFVEEGKATIRFYQPQHDVIMSKADPIMLKGFLNILKLGVQGKEVSRTSLSTLAPASSKQVEKLKTRMSIQNRKDYPLTCNFPSSLKQLQVMHCSLKKFDSRMLQLQHLQVLDLSDNVISQVPQDFGRLNNLSDLKLANNQITEFPTRLCFGKLQNSLKLLDMTENKIKRLPPQFYRLKSLVNLKLDNNEIQVLPNAIGRLQSLRFLCLAKNQIRTLPASFRLLRLENLDMFENPLVNESDNNNVTSRLELPTLLESAARTIKKRRIVCGPEDITQPLFDYIQTAKWCLCGSPCFQSCASFISQADLRSIAGTVVALNALGRMHAPVETFLCSQKCLEKYRRNPHALWK